MEVSPMTALKQRMLEDLRIRNYAPTTISNYIRSVAEFARHFNKPPDQLGAEEVRLWQLFLLNENRVKLSSYIQAICALRFFYQNTLHRRIEIDRIPLPVMRRNCPLFSPKLRSRLSSKRSGTLSTARFCAMLGASALIAAMTNIFAVLLRFMMNLLFA
jgi:hypothetical protein